MKTLKTKLAAARIAAKWLALVAVREFNLFTCVHPRLREEARREYAEGYARLEQEALKL